MKYCYFLITLFLLAFTFACKKDNPETERIVKPKLTGAVEKGPFLKGSQISIVELSADLNPTGRIFKTEILSDLGHFEMNDLALVSPYVQVLVDGFYFNEVTGALSNSRITLGALVDISSQNTVNVNVITHLEQRRVKHLMQEGATFVQAKKQASSEILRAFYIGEELDGTSDNVSLVDNNNNAASLLAISSALLNMVSSDAALTETLSSLAQQIESDGALSEADSERIKQSIRSLNMEYIADNVVTRYRDLGMEVEIPDFLDVIPIDEITEQDFFTTEEDFIVAYGAAVKSFYEYYQAFAVFEAAYAHTVDASTNPTYFEIAGHQFAPTNTPVFQLWVKAYGTVRMFSLLVQKGEGSQLTMANEIARYAHTHLGYLYWSMMTLWGDIPYLDPAQLDNIITPPRTRMIDILSYLTPSIEAAAQHIQAASNQYGVSRSFPLAVLARLYLSEGNYLKAKQYAEDVIQSGLFSLSPDPWGGTENVYGYTLSADFLEELVNPDYRELINSSNTIQYVTYPEIVLTASEACLNLGEVDQAVGYLNQIRQSKGKSALASTDRAVIEQALLDEIKDELGKDGLWFSALKRNGKAEEVLDIPAYRELIPIPQQEMERNPTMTQNPGY
ncbi:MAG: RagB/SusD family nutrient uptake outer membrane protein [Parapedobacter sp.]|nr:MAG: RagB/SusD family nutrient uptake outer membrane protein [Parapedobacter sp.]